MSPEMVSNNMKILAVDAFRKAGASNADIERIEKLSAEGKSVDQISEQTNVQIAIVLRFLPTATKAFMGKPLPTYDDDPFAEAPAPLAVESSGSKFKELLKGAKKHGTKHK